MYSSCAFIVRSAPLNSSDGKSPVGSEEGIHFGRTFVMYPFSGYQLRSKEYMMEFLTTVYQIVENRERDGTVLKSINLNSKFIY